MLKFILVAISLANLFFSIKQFKNISKTMSLRKLNIISYFFYYFIFLSFIGCLLLTVNINSFYMSDSLRNSNSTMYKSWFAINSVLFITPLVQRFIMEKFNLINNPYEEFCKSGMNDNYHEKRMFYIMLLLTLISSASLIYVFYTIGFENIPIINSFQGVDPETLAILRQNATRGFKGNVYIKNILAFGFFPILSYISFVELVNRRSLKWFILCIITVIGTSLSLTYDLQKAPILRYIFSFMILIPLFLRPISKKGFRVVMVSLVTIVLSYYIFLTPAPLSEVISFNKGPVNRVLKSQVFPTYLHVDIFPNEHEFLGGASFPSVISENVFGKSHIRSGRLVMEITRPEAVANGTAGVLNTLYIAEAYANFSWPGVLFSIIWVSMVLYLTHYIILINKKTPVTIALYVYLANLLVNATQGGFVDFIYNPGVVIIVGVVLMTNFIVKKTH